MLDQLKLEGLNNAQWLKVRMTKQRNEWKCDWWMEIRMTEQCLII